MLIDLVEHRKEIRTTIQRTRSSPQSFSEFKKRLDPSASYVIAEKPSDGNGRDDLIEFAELAVAFGKLTESQNLIYDASIDKLILVIKLTTNVDGRFFRDAIPTDALKNMSVCLYSNRRT
jgi:hypothetical protein